ncbi:unnamed protein product [Peronospora belbahrii]|uniref:Purple acid phosphatase n=1 Tax=Peronospora belbahrii TaxID=622444 RepID=A0ABN8D2Y6_9STRA|nr:unnamed protein product [Peronospora belbahrii]
MQSRIVVKLVVYAIALCSVTSAKSAGLKALVKSFFSNDDATDEHADQMDPSMTDDRTCVFKWSSFSCEPKDRCSLQYQFGDITPSQACRVTDTCDHTKEPQQIHLAYAGKEPGTGMAISWATFSLEEFPAVWIGTSKTTIDIVKTARIETKSYYKDDDYSLYNYHAVVTGLKPYTEYFYKVGNATNPKAQSTVSSFMTARSSGDNSPSVVAVLGDMGTEKYSIATNKYLNSLETWNKYMNSLSKVMRRMAYMVVVGNHEAECHSPVCIWSTEKKNQLGNYTAFNTRFKMPSHECGGALNMWYSFVYGLMHVVACSSETDFPNPPNNAYFTNRKYGNFGNQLAWLEADLKAAHANRANVPWIVVAMHRPLYTLRSCDANGVPTDDYEALKVQKAFEKLLIKYKVDLVLQGHVHAYERHYPTADSKAIMDGVSKDGGTYTNPLVPVYIITGHGGNSEGLYPFKNPPTPEWLAVVDNTHYGITKLLVTATNLTVTMIESATEKVYDKFSIIKNVTAYTQAD